MNKKTLAIAAVALFATSGLASAQTVRHVTRVHQPREISRTMDANALLYGDVRPGNSGPVSEYRRALGDNDMDPWMKDNQGE